MTPVVFASFDQEGCFMLMRGALRTKDSDSSDQQAKE
jgi:hypothetical protein